jgi:hypothetical protein
MNRLIRYLSIGLSLIAAPSAIFAQTNPFQGVYTGKSLVLIIGSQPKDYPSRMTVLPDGHSIFITTQVPNTVVTSVITGNFKGNIFEGATRGRMNFLSYIWSSSYKIRFVGNEAVIEQVFTPNGPIKGGHRISHIYYRIRS